MDHKRLLLKNTLMLYLLTFSGYLFSFLTVPYQTRILGPEIYGALGFAQACSVYAQLFLDFGFLLSATEDAANHREEPEVLSGILSAVLGGKLLLGAAGLAVMTMLCAAVPVFREDWLLHELFYLSAFSNALLPDFLYRGLEKMDAIAYRTVAVKLFFTAAVFVFLRSEADYYAVPILNALGGAGACAWAYADVRKRLGVKLVRARGRDVYLALRRSAPFFLSRIATTVYGAANTVILGLIAPMGGTLGYYTSAEKLMTTARSAVSPIADSLYPYMVKNRDFALVKKLLLILMPLIIAGCTLVGIFAEPFCAVLFGEEFRESGALLRLLLPVVAVSLPTYVFGFPVLSPMGLAGYANTSVVAGAVVHGVQLAVLYLIGSLNVRTVCAATCVTELVILGIRVAVVLKNRKTGGKA